MLYILGCGDIVLSAKTAKLNLDAQNDESWSGSNAEMSFVPDISNDKH